MSQLLHFFLLSLLLSVGIKADSPVFEPFNLAEFEKSLELDSLPTEEEAAQEPDTEITRGRKNKRLRTLSVSRCAKINSLVVCSNAAIRCNLAVGGNLAVAGSGSFGGGLTIGGPLVIGGATIGGAGGTNIFPGNVIFESTVVPGGLNVIGNSAETCLNLRRGTVNPLAGPAGTDAHVRPATGGGYTAVTTTTSALLGVVPLGSSVAVTFTPAYTSAPTVVVSLEGATAVPAVGFTVEVTDVTTAGFTATIFNTATGLPVTAGVLPAGTLINFMAIGGQC